MKSFLPSLAGIVLLGFLDVAGCVATPPKKTAAPPPTVLVAPVERRDVPVYIDAVATLDGYDNADIRARVKGYLRAQSYKDGWPVKAGQVLFSIESSDYEAAVAAARAAVTRAMVAQAHAKLQVERDRNLVKSGMLSQEELDSAHATLADSEGQIQAAQAQLDQAKLNLSYTQVMSPLAGVAGLPLVRVGNLVGQDGPTLLTTVSQLDPIRVNFPLPEADFMRYRNRIALLGTRDLAWAKAAFAKLATTGVTDEGEPGVELVVADGSVYPLRGVTVTANRQIDPTTGTIQMQALFPNPGGELRPGGYGHVRIKRPDAGKNTLVVPEKALISIQGSYSVAVVGPENKVSLRPVVVGGSCQGLRMVTSGIAEGEVIVVEGTQKIAEGALVDPKPAPASARAEVAAPPAPSVTPRLDSALTSSATPKN